MRAPCCITALACLCVFTVLSTLACNYSATELIQHVRPAFEYAIVCDAGSSGTRMHIFHIPAGADVKGSRITEVGRRDIEPGLGSFAEEASRSLRSTAAAAYLRPLFEFAATRIPRDAHRRTAVFIRGTGGLRALPSRKARMLYRQVRACSGAAMLMSLVGPVCFFVWYGTHLALICFDSPHPSVAIRCCGNSGAASALIALLCALRTSAPSAAMTKPFTLH